MTYVTLTVTKKSNIPLIKYVYIYIYIFQYLLAGANKTYVDIIVGRIEGVIQIAWHFNNPTSDKTECFTILKYISLLGVVLKYCGKLILVVAPKLFSYEICMVLISYLDFFYVIAVSEYILKKK